MLLSTITNILSKEKNINDSHTIRDNIIKLKLIGTFKPNEKIDVKNLRIEQNTIFTPIKRMIYGESRTTTFDFLNHTIEKTYEIINIFIRSDKLSEKIFCKNILNDLVACISGLKNIQRTYNEDNLFYSNVQYLIENIQAKLLEIKEQYPDIFNLQETFFINRQDGSGSGNGSGSGSNISDEPHSITNLDNQRLPEINCGNIENKVVIENKQFNNKKTNK